MTLLAQAEKPLMEVNSSRCYLLCDWRELESESEEVPIAIEEANGLCCGLGVLVNVDGACDGACELGGVSLRG